MTPVAPQPGAAAQALRGRHRLRVWRNNKVRDAFERILINSDVPKADIPAVIASLDQLPDNIAAQYATELMHRFGAQFPDLPNNLVAVVRGEAVATPQPTTLLGGKDTARRTINESVREVMGDQGRYVGSVAEEKFGPGVTATKAEVEERIGKTRGAYRRLLNPNRPYGNARRMTAERRAEIDLARQRLKDYLREQERFDQLPDWILQDAMNRLNDDLRAMGEAPLAGGADFMGFRDVLIDRYPTQIAHALQSSYATGAREAAKSTDLQAGAMRRDLTRRRGRSRIRANAADPDARGFGLLHLLEEAVPGYRETRVKFGNEMGELEAADIPKRMVAASRSEEGVQEIADDLDELTPEQYLAAKSGITTLVNDLMRRKIENPTLAEHGAGEMGVAMPNLTQISEKGFLDALPKWFGDDGQALADSIRRSRATTSTLQAIDPKFSSRTEVNAQDVKNARGLFEDPKAKTRPVIDTVTSVIGTGAALATGNVPVQLGLAAIAAGRALWNKLQQGKYLTNAERSQLVEFLMKVRRGEAETHGGPPAGPAPRGLPPPPGGGGSRGKPDAMGFAPQPQERGPVFFSALERAIEKSPQQSATAQQWKNTLANTPGVKKEELLWTGLDDWLDSGLSGFSRGINDMERAKLAPIPREDILAFLKGHGVQVDEVLRSEETRAATIADRAQELEDNFEREFYEAGHFEPPYYPKQDKETGEWFVGWDGNSRRDVDDVYANEEEALAAVDEANSTAEYEALVEAKSQKDFERMAESEMEADDDQFSGWTLPGGRNYSELLLTLPKIDGPDTHWDTPNVVAHVRFKERKDAAGKRVLAIEEIQSDWHQKARKEYEKEVKAARKAGREPRGNGYAMKASESEIRAADEARQAAIVEAARVEQEFFDILSNDPNTMKAYKDFEEVKSAARGSMKLTDWARRGNVDQDLSPKAIEKRAEWDMARLRADETRQAYTNAINPKGIPDAPFKNNAWATLALKRMIRYAADNGFDSIAWTPGQVQNERYNLSKATGKIRAYTDNDGSSFVVNVNNEAANALVENGLAIEKPRGGGVIMTPDQMREAFGENIASQIIERGAPTSRSGGEEVILDGDDLRVGGKGMIKFYDEILRNEANKLGKKYGAQVGESREPNVRAHGVVRAHPTVTGYALLNNRNQDVVPDRFETEDAALRHMNILKAEGFPGQRWHSLPITPELKNAALGGFSKFSLAREAVAPAIAYGFGSIDPNDEYTDEEQAMRGAAAAGVVAGARGIPAAARAVKKTLSAIDNEGARIDAVPFKTHDGTEWMVEFDDGGTSGAHVTFKANDGPMKSTDPLQNEYTPTGKADLGQMREILDGVADAIRQDIEVNSRDAYLFVGRTPRQNLLYARLANRHEPPPGYVWEIGEDYVALSKTDPDAAGFVTDHPLKGANDRDAVDRLTSPEVADPDEYAKRGKVANWQNEYPRDFGRDNPMGVRTVEDSPPARNDQGEKAPPDAMGFSRVRERQPLSRTELAEAEAELSDQQLDILKGARRGIGTKQLAKNLGVSEGTIRTTLTRLRDMGFDVNLASLANPISEQTRDIIAYAAGDTDRKAIAAAVYPDVPEHEALNRVDVARSRYRDRIAAAREAGEGKQPPKNQEGEEGTGSKRFHNVVGFKRGREGGWEPRDLILAVNDPETKNLFDVSMDMGVDETSARPANLVSKLGENVRDVIREADAAGGLEALAKEWNVSVDELTKFRDRPRAHNEGNAEKRFAAVADIIDESGSELRWEDVAAQLRVKGFTATAASLKAMYNMAKKGRYKLSPELRQRLIDQGKKPMVKQGFGFKLPDTAVKAFDQIATEGDPARIWENVKRQLKPNDPRQLNELHEVMQGLSARERALIGRNAEQPLKTSAMDAGETPTPLSELVGQYVSKGYDGQDKVIDKAAKRHQTMLADRILEDQRGEIVYPVTGQTTDKINRDRNAGPIGPMERRIEALDRAMANQAWFPARESEREQALAELIMEGSNPSGGLPENAGALDRLREGINAGAARGVGDIFPKDEKRLSELIFSPSGAQEAARMTREPVKPWVGPKEAMAVRGGAAAAAGGAGLASYLAMADEDEQLPPSQPAMERYNVSDRVMPKGNPTESPPWLDAHNIDTVKTAQKRLVALGYLPGEFEAEADGIVGPKTRPAIEAFQRDNDLPVTGEFNPATLRAIFGGKDYRQSADPAFREYGEPIAEAPR